MGAQPLLKFQTVEEYLAFERAALEKHEYYKGEIFDMACASFAHNKLQMNFTREVGSFLKGKSCDVFGSDLRIHIPQNSLFTYPDAIIVCDKPEMLDKEFDTVLNPGVIVEILSKSTQSYDRGDKFMLYRSIPSLKEYILINSEKKLVEHYARNDNDTWLLKELAEHEQLNISTINFSLSIADLYNGVSFA